MRLVAVARPADDEGRPNVGGEAAHAFYRRLGFETTKGQRVLVCRFDE